MTQQKGLENHNLVVTAGAGAGKTTMLVSKFLHLIQRENEPLNPERVMAITFTRKAAEEMRMRIVDAVRKSSLTNSRRLEYLVYQAPIMTYDALFQRIYRDFGPEVGFSPEFSLIDEVEKREIANQVYWQLIKNLRDFPEKYHELKSAVDYFYSIDRSHLIKTIMTQMVVKPFFADERFAWLFQYQLGPSGCVSLNTYLDWLSDLNGWPSKDIEFQWVKLAEDAGTSAPINQPPAAFIQQLMVDIQSQPDTSLKDRFIALTNMIDSGQRTPLSESAGTVRYYYSVLYISALEKYDHVKLLRQRVDYHDIQNRVFLLSQNAGIQTSLFQSVDYLLIDEFQDTNHLNWKIIKPFVWNKITHSIQPDKLFIVGDPKQSIYRFRHVDSYWFYQVADMVSEQANYPSMIYLDENFRSTGVLVDVINTFFKDELALSNSREPIEGQAVYHPMTLPKESMAHENKGWVEWVSCPKTSLYQSIATHLKNLLESKTYDWDPDGDRIAILATRNQLLLDCATVLDLNEIGYSMVTDQSALESDEGRDFVHLLSFLDYPHDDLAFVGLVKSPIFKMKDEVLIALKLNPSAENYWDAIQTLDINTLNIDENEKSKLFIFKNFMKDTLNKKQSLSLGEVAWQVYQQTGAFDYYNKYKQGDEKTDHILALLSYFMTLESNFRSGGKNPVQMMKTLMMEKADVDVSNTSRVLKHKVELLTVHKAKGLTFSHVYLIDSFDKRSGSTQEPWLTHPEKGTAFKSFIENEWKQAGFFKDIQSDDNMAEKAEKNRVVYVAMTRAQKAIFWFGDGTRIQEKDEVPTSITWFERFFLMRNRFKDYPTVKFYSVNPELPVVPIKKWDPPEIGTRNQVSEWEKQFVIDAEAISNDSYYTNFTATGIMAVNQCGTASRLKKVSIFKSQKKSGFNRALFGSHVHYVLSLSDSEVSSLSGIPGYGPDYFQTLISIRNQVLSSLPHFTDTIINEFPFILRLEDRTVTGSMDRIEIGDQFVRITDYKTNQLNGRRLEDLFSQYELQLQLYGLAACYLFPFAEEIELSLFSTEKMESFSKTYQKVELLTHFQPVILELIKKIENKEFDKDYRLTEPYKCEACSYFSTCFQDHPDLTFSSRQTIQ